MTPPPTKTKQKTYGVLLCWLTTPGNGACLGVWLIHPVTLHWRILILPFPGGVYHMKGILMQSAYNGEIMPQLNYQIYTTI